jgi:hypothetical protein
MTRVARYYYHETVRVRNAEDDVQGNVRIGLDVTKATNYKKDLSQLPSASTAELGAPSLHIRLVVVVAHSPVTGLTTTLGTVAAKGKIN